MGLAVLNLPHAFLSMLGYACNG